MKSTVGIKDSYEHENKKKVYVGLSGGVDSSVAAALLQKQGYDVVGVFIKIWHKDISNCDWKAEMRDAMRVCAHLDIPFKMIDLSEEYLNRVITYLIEEYQQGNTPNPDVMCNSTIKFAAFYDWARSDGADVVATGHYAQVADGVLLRGIDPKKDQSYFLWNIKRDVLKNVLFPVGQYEKTYVRTLAEQFGLPTATKKDSQGLCFIGDVNLKEFLKGRVQLTPGDVLDIAGNVIGVHDGALLYTIGERHGFRITTSNDNQKAHYVIAKDITNNTITVGIAQELRDQFITEVSLRSVNLLADSLSCTSLSAMVRYQGELHSVEIIKQETDAIALHLDHPIQPVATGQSVVLYCDEVCLGGGVVVACK